MLAALPPGGTPLERFLPEMADADGPGAALRHRAALASTLLAGLELGRDGGANLAQEEAFGPILLLPAGPRWAEAAPPRLRTDRYPNKASPLWRSPVGTVDRAKVAG